MLIENLLPTRKNFNTSKNKVQIFLSGVLIKYTMKITAINNNQNINFTAGKTRILSDFDGTFMPKEFGHDIVCNNNPPVDSEAFSSYFGDFRDFFETQNKDDKKTELTISTGRNLYEFNYYMKKIKDKGLAVPNPDKLIITNGGDEFVRRGEDYFSSDKKAMFNSYDVNNKKRTKLKEFVVSYNPYKVRQQIRGILKSLTGSPVVFEPKTHQGMYGYQDNMTLQEKVEKNGNITNYVSMRRDGAYQIRLTAPMESEHLEPLKQIPQQLIDMGYDIDFEVDEKDNETCVNLATDGSVWNLGTSVDIKPTTRGKIKVLDKFHHAKLMADEIMKNNSDDLVVVAGDGGNDLKMLNLSNYIDSMEDFNDFSKPEFRDEISKLPIISIFVRNSSSLDDKVLEYEKAFNFDGQTRFIIVDKGNPDRPQTLLDAIKLAQVEYAKRNEKFSEEFNK